MHEWVKPALKASTHVLTIGGVVVASSPVLNGAHLVAQGNLTGAKDQILVDTIGTAGSTSVKDSLTNATVKVGIPLAVGIGLVWLGGQLRKRIGN